MSKVFDPIDELDSKIKELIRERESHGKLLIRYNQLERQFNWLDAEFTKLSDKIALNNLLESKPKLPEDVAIKFDDDKLRYDLLSPYALEEIVKVYNFGAKKYADRNWEKGLKYNRLLASMLRHIEAFRKGEDIDQDSNCHHMASVCFNAMAILHFWKTQGNNTLDDRVHYDSTKTD